MTAGRDIILDYQAAASRNHYIFLLNHSYAFHAFGGLNDYFESLGRILQTQRDSAGKSYVSFIPFLLLMQRQANSAFQSFWAHQSYQGWVLLRPCLESALIMGKWVDNKAHAALWSNRQKDPDAYRREFSGKKLRSQSLPSSVELQTILSRINDDFMHLNAGYYHRHTETLPLDAQSHVVQVQYFDNGADLQAHLFAFLRSVALCVDSVAGLFKKLFPSVVLARPALPLLETELGEAVRRFAAEQPGRAPVLKQLGFWKLK